MEVEGPWGSYDNTHIARPGRLSTTPWEPSSSSSSWPLSAPICKRLPHKTEQAVTKREKGLHIHPSLGGGEKNPQKSQCEGRDSVEQPRLTAPELRAAALSSNSSQSSSSLAEGEVGQVRLDPLLHRCSLNYSKQMSPMFRLCTLAGSPPPFKLKIKRDDEERGRSKQLSQEAITLL